MWFGFVFIQKNAKKKKKWGAFQYLLPQISSTYHSPTYSYWISTIFPKKVFTYLFSYGLQLDLNKIPESEYIVEYWSPTGFLLKYQTIYCYRFSELNWGHVTSLWWSIWSVKLIYCTTYLMYHLQNLIQHLSPLPYMASSSVFPSHIGCGKTT